MPRCCVARRVQTDMTSDCSCTLTSGWGCIISVRTTRPHKLYVTVPGVERDGQTAAVGKHINKSSAVWASVQQPADSRPGNKFAD